MIEISNLKFRILEIDRLCVPNGITCIIGENGSGKSTLARLLCGYYEAKTGSILADGVPVRSLDTGYVPEFFDNGIIFENVADEITSPLRFAFETPEKIAEKLSAAAELIGIADLADKETRNISGGEKACVALATAIISSPRILVLDEPDSHLDRETTKRIMAALKGLHGSALYANADATNAEDNSTVRGHTDSPYIIHCTQNMDIAADADFLIFMEKGRVKYSGSPSAVFEKLKLQGSPFLPTKMRIDAAVGKAANATGDSSEIAEFPAFAETAANASDACAEIPQKLELKGLKISRGGFTLNADAVFESGVHIITGRTGSGKSTLAYALSESGLAEVADGVVSSAEIEKRVFLMQFASYHITQATVEKEIASWGKTAEETEKVLKYLGLAERRNFDPAKLSAGEIKRLHLACILSGDADLIILDEPFSTLDIAGKEEFAAYPQFSDAGSRVSPKIIIIFTHEKTVLPHADHIWEIKDNRLEYLGKASETQTLKNWNGAPEYIGYALSKGADIRGVTFADAVYGIGKIAGEEDASAHGMNGGDKQ